MTGSQVFSPPRTQGIVLHAVLVLFILAGTGVLLALAFSQPAGGLLILYLVGSLLFLAMLPLAVYRGYALLRGGYTIERDGLRVRWGLRSEDIPLTEVIWVRDASELETGLLLPRFSMPGAILGKTEHEELGPIEFVASSAENLVIVSTINKTLVLSPEDPGDFVRKFQRFIEMGSLSPIPPHTAVPAAFIEQVMSDRYARILIPLSAGLTLVLLILTNLLIPAKESISLGFDITRAPRPPVPSGRLLLLPVISIFFTLVDLITGVFLFRKVETRPISFFIWSAGVLTSIVMLIAVLVLFFTPS